MKTLTSLLCVSLFGLSALSGAAEMARIPLEKGDFEQGEVVPGLDEEKQESQGDRWGSWEFTKDAWSLAAPGNIPEGENAVTIWGPATLVFDIPRKLRGRSLEVTFLGKGEASFATYGGTDRCYLLPEIEKKKMTERDWIYSIGTNFIGNSKFEKTTKFRVVFPPLPQNVKRVRLVLNHNGRGRQYIPEKARLFHIDKAEVRASAEPFYKLNRTSPLEISDMPKDFVLKSGKDESFALPLDSLKGKSFEVRFRASGTGTVTTEVKVNGKTSLKVMSGSPGDLTGDLIPYSKWFSELHETTEKAELCFKTSGQADIRGVQVLLADRLLVTYPYNLSDIPGEKLPSDYVSGRSPDCNGLADISKYAEIHAPDSFVLRNRLIADGTLGSTGKMTTVFRFPKPVSVSELRVTLPPANMFAYADVKGNGVYDVPLFEKLNGLRFSTWADLKDYVWYRKQFDTPVTLYGIKYIGGAHEFRILSTPETAAALEKEFPVAKPGPAPLLEFGKKVEVPKASGKDTLYFGFCLEPWMFGIQEHMGQYYRNKKLAPVPEMGADEPLELETETPEKKIEKITDLKSGGMEPFAEWTHWKAILADFKTLHANFILLFPPSTNVLPPGEKVPVGSYPYPVMWDSRVWAVNQPLPILKEMNASCKENGILNFVIPREWLFRKEETKTPKQIIFAQEIADQNSDGVPICVDEQAIGTGCTVKAGEQDEFKAFSGLSEAPEKRADTEAVRKAHLFRLSKISKWMAEIYENTKKTHPDALTFGGFAGTEHYKDRLSAVSAHDAWGFDGKCDVIGGDGTYFGVNGNNESTYTPAIGTAMHAACTPTRLAMQTVNFNWGMKWENGRMFNPLVNDDFPVTSYYGGALTTYFQKGVYLNFWRYNYMDMKGPATRKAVTAAGRMTETLAGWGGRRAMIPKDVLVLRSRVSEDWWNLKQEFAVSDDPKFAAKKDARRELGFTNFHWLASRLLENAVPFEVYMMNRPDAWKDIADKYKVIVLPFAYAVSEQEAGQLRKAADAGVRILALGGAPLAAADEFGNVRAKPLLDDLTQSGKLKIFPLDAVYSPNTDRVIGDFRKLLFESLGKDGPSITLEKERDYDVQAYALEVSEREKLILLVNWSERDTAVNLGVRLPAGEYRLEVCGLEDTVTGKVDGREVVTEKELAKFRVNLPKEDTKILRVYAK